MSKKLSARQVFTMWKTEVEKDIGKARYTSTERLEQLDALCEYFVKFGVDFDDALGYKKDFTEFVVTKEGMKGNGKYKGWKEKASENYEGLLTSWYNGEFKVVNDIGNITVKENVSAASYGSNSYMIRIPLIVAWSKEYFGSEWSEGVCLECHKINGPLTTMFEQEVLESNWMKTGQNVPNWAKKYCY